MKIYQNFVELFQKGCKMEIDTSGYIDKTNN